METKCKYIFDYLNSLESGEVPASQEMLKACALIRRKLDDDRVFVNVDRIEKAIELIERYFHMNLFPWEKLVIALIHCYYPEDDTLVFDEFLIMMGRGNGKNGFISGVAWYLTTHYHGVQGYNVDIIANSEEQATTSFNDIYEMLEDTWDKSKKFFHKTKEVITNLKTRSYIKFNTSNARTKDGKRSACLIFDELHEYENSNIIDVFTSGFGKRKHSRIFKITTNGFVRDGVLDDDLRIANDVLNGEIPNSRMCPLIYKLDDEKEADNSTLWVKANPSLPYLPVLRLAIESEYQKKDYDERTKRSLMTKRFNLPKADAEIAVTEYTNIQATNKPLPDLTRWSCTVGIDYAELSDWAAVNLHFRKGDERYDINHAWICAQSKTLWRVKAPYRDWANRGDVTIVDDVSIRPDLITNYIAEAGRKYNIKGLAMDNFRWALMADSLGRIGFDARDKQRVKLIRPSDIMQVEPIIQECFNRQLFTWGDVPHLRWAVNNTKRVCSSRKEGSDTGNFIYAKIEAKSRKTDPFMALVASMTLEHMLGGQAVISPRKVKAYTF